MIIILLLILLEIKHIISDYFLQSDWIGIGKRLEHGWIPALTLHAGYHGIGTCIAVFIVTRNFYWAIIAALFDFSTHFIIDRIKSSLNMFGPYYGGTSGWILFIIDQLLHHLVIWIIAYWIFKERL